MASREAEAQLTRAQSKSSIPEGLQRVACETQRAYKERLGTEIFMADRGGGDLSYAVGSEGFPMSALMGRNGRNWISNQ
jgi:hypothetical protein